MAPMPPMEREQECDKCVAESQVPDDVGGRRQAAPGRLGAACLVHVTMHLLRQERVFPTHASGRWEELRRSWCRADATPASSSKALFL